MKFIYLFIISLPLMNIPKPLFMGAKIQYADLIFIPILALFMNNLLKGKFKLIRDKLDLGLLILAFFPLLSLLHSPFKDIAVWDTLGLFYLISLYFVFTRFINNKELFQRIVCVLFIVSAFASLFGILIFLFANVFRVWVPHNLVYEKSMAGQSTIIPFARPSSLLSLPEMFINFSLLGMAAGFICRSLYLKRRRLIDLSLILIVLSVFLSFSRPLVGVMLFLTAVSFYFFGNNFIGRALKISSLAVFLILLCLTLLIWVVTIYPVGFNIDSSSGMAHLSFNPNWDTRVYLAKAALGMARAHPFLGLGLGSYTDNLTSFLTQEDLSRLAAMRPEDVPNLRIDPHSLYFGSLAEMGFLGVVALLFVFWGLFSKMKLAFGVSGKNRILKDSCFIFLAAFCGFLLNGFFVDILSMRSFWLLMSLGTVAADLVNQEAGRD